MAIELLLVAPMRVGNLCALERDRHIVDIGRRRALNRYIVIPGEMVKNNETLEILLPSESTKLLDVYLKSYRPRICPGPSPYVFPGLRGYKRSTIPFSTAISKFIERETGIRMHCHLFRHLAGKIHLEAIPQDIETVRRILGHRTSQTTLRYYAEQSTTQAFKQYDRTLAAHRGPQTLVNESSSRMRKGGMTNASR